MLVLPPNITYTRDAIYMESNSIDIRQLSVYGKIDRHLIAGINCETEVGLNSIYQSWSFATI